MRPSRYQEAQQGKIECGCGYTITGTTLEVAVRKWVVEGLEKVSRERHGALKKKLLDILDQS